MAQFSQTLSNNYYRLVLNVNETSTSVANNTSSVSWSLVLYSIGANFIDWDVSRSVVINGSSVLSLRRREAISRGGSLTLGSGSTTVPHNADGTKTLSCSASISATGAWYLPGSMGVSGSMGLTKIARATQPSAAGADLGQKITINCPRASSSFSHTLRYEWSGKKGVIATGVGTSYTWTVPLDFVRDIPNSSQQNLVIVCDTYNGSSFIGTKRAYVSMKVPASIVPIIDSIAVSEAVSKVKSNFTKYVRGMSQASVAVEASGVYGSTIKGYLVELDGVSYTSKAFTSNVLQGDGSLPLKVTVTDSRGRSASDTRTLEVYPYTTPIIEAADISQSGSTTYLRVKGSVDSVSGENEKALSIRYKPISGSTWESVETIPGAWNFDNLVELRNMDSTVTYQIVAELRDKINTAVFTTSTGKPVISRLAGGKGVTLFKEAEEEGFWVGNIDYTITDEEYARLMALLE